MNDWYYTTDSATRSGPVSFVELQSLVQAGTLRRTDLLWQDGWPAWQSASSTPGLFGPPAVLAPTLYATQTRRPSRCWTPEDFRIMWFHFMLWTIIGIPTSFVLIGIPAIIAGIVCWSIFLYRAWDQAQAFSTRATPGEAVGLCFVPFYGLYWQFVAYRGLAKDMNRHASSIGLPESLRVSEDLVTACCIMTCVAAVPYLGLVAWLPLAICCLIAGTQYKNLAMAIAAFNADQSFHA